MPSISRSFIRFAVVALAVAAFAAPSLADEAKRPNVVIFLADDLGWADVGYHGEEVIETPSIDRIAAEGVQLDRFYSTHAREVVALFDNDVQWYDLWTQTRVLFLAPCLGAPQAVQRVRERELIA